MAGNINFPVASDTSSNHDVETHAEEEYANYKRQYRIMEGDRSAYQQGVQNRIRRQLKLVTRLQKEDEELITNLRLAQSSAVRKKDSENLSEINDLFQAQTCYIDIVGNEKNSIQNVRDRIRQVEAEIERHQQQNGGAISSHERNVDVIKRTRVLENRLNSGTVQFNKLLTENNELRENIEHYRSQRKVFNNLYRRLTAKLNQQKGQIATVIDAATAAYDQRDDCRVKMISLRDRNEKEFSHFVSEYKEMNRVIAHESTLQSFMNTKNCELSQLALEEVKKRKDSFENKSDTLQEEEMVRFEKVLAAVIKILGQEQGVKLITILGAQLPQKEKVAELETAIRPVCERYVKTEEQNYSLFQFVNEMSQDVKRLQSRFAKIEDKNSFEKKIIHKSITEADEKIANLQNEISTHTEADQNLKNQIRDAESRYKGLKGDTMRLFQSIGCSADDIQHLLDNETLMVNDQNLVLYLSIIENNINSLFGNQVLKNAQNEEDEEGRDSRKSNRRAKSRGGVSQHSVEHTKTKTKSLDDSPTTSMDLLDQHFQDFEKEPLSLTELRRRAKFVITVKEKERNAATTKMPRSASKASREKKRSK